MAYTSHKAVAERPVHTWLRPKRDCMSYWWLVGALHACGMVEVDETPTESSRKAKSDTRKVNGALKAIDELVMKKDGQLLVCNDFPSQILPQAPYSA